ncbi:hypothetical protein HGA34_02950 [Candidatus Falkowbacteria bacterium]|nr:hypothetical protein [Candidatus Falkowbacteria bacterium]
MKTSELLRNKAARAAGDMIVEGLTLKKIDTTDFFVATSVPDGYSCWDQFQHKDQTVFIVWEKEE